MADLSRVPQSPVYCVAEAIKKIPALKGHDIVEIPEIVSVESNFDLLGAPADHPSRSRSDTFYIDEHYVLRTQTTTMWSYYLRDRAVLKMLDTEKSVLALCHGKAYRKDEIDRNHYPVFHQIDGLRISERAYCEYTIDDLKEILVQIACAVFGTAIEWRIEDDTFPFTRPSIQLLINWNDQWLEIVGAGLVNPDVLRLLGLDPLKYNGWAFGFGLDRIAMIRMDIPDIRILWSTDERIVRQFTGIDSRYKPVSKFPPTDRDISFVIESSISVNEIYHLMRECGVQGNEDLIEEVTLIDTFGNEKMFGPGKISRTFRIRYRSPGRTLTTDEFNMVQENVRLLVMKELNAVLR